MKNHKKRKHNFRVCEKNEYICSTFKVHDKQRLHWKNLNIVLWKHTYSFVDIITYKRWNDCLQRLQIRGYRWTERVPTSFHFHLVRKLFKAQPEPKTLDFKKFINCSKPVQAVDPNSTTWANTWHKAGWGTRVWKTWNANCGCLHVLNWEDVTFLLTSD